MEKPDMDWDSTVLTSLISRMCSSSLSVTSSSTRWGEAPGKTVVTIPVRMVKSGSSALGMEKKVMTPLTAMSRKRTREVRLLSMHHLARFTASPPRPD